MSDCCTGTVLPGSTMSQGDCCQGVVLPGVNITVTGPGSGCAPTMPRDLDGEGLLVTIFVFDGSAGQSVFTGVDRYGKDFSAVPNQTMIMVNGAVLDPEDYVLTTEQLSLNEPCEYNGDNVTAIVFREPDYAAFQDLVSRVEALEALHEGEL